MSVCYHGSVRHVRLVISRVNDVRESGTKEWKIKGQLSFVFRLFHSESAGGVVTGVEDHTEETDIEPTEKVRTPTDLFATIYKNVAFLR